MTASSAVRRSRTHLLFFFFNDTATTEIYTLSLHDALPICCMFDCTGHGVPGAFMTLIALSFLEQAVAPAGIGTGTGAVIDPGALLGQMNRYIKRVLQQRSRDVQPAWGAPAAPADGLPAEKSDRKSTRLNSSHSQISYAVFCLKKKKIKKQTTTLRHKESRRSNATRPLRVTLSARS